jgi:hypothetical protein
MADVKQDLRYKTCEACTQAILQYFSYQATECDDRILEEIIAAIGKVACRSNSEQMEYRNV